jgi:L-ribulose-5-phosphate 4-epimerase
MKEWEKSIEASILLNIELFNSDLVIDTFGNGSQRVDYKHFAIKPSGVNPSQVSTKDTPIIEISSGKQVAGRLKPSSDTPTHCYLYSKFPEIGGIIHSHSLYATAWAQSNLSIPIFGTTHADYWQNEVPITRELKDFEIQNQYEHNTGKVIEEALKKASTNPLKCPGVLVSQHGPFTWGEDLKSALKSAYILEFVSKLANLTITLNPNAKINHILAKKHFDRKHGKDAYYGQKDFSK